MQSRQEWKPWSKEKRLEIGNQIYQDHNYGRILWTCGFVKTATSSALFVTGFTLIFNGLTNHPMFRGWDNAAIVFGITAVILGLFVIYVIDKKRERMKKEEYGKNEEDIERKIFEHNQDVLELSHEVANEVVRHELEKQLEALRFEDCDYGSNSFLTNDDDD